MGNLNEQRIAIIYGRAAGLPTSPPAFAGQIYMRETDGHFFGGVLNSDGDLVWQAATAVIGDGSIATVKLADGAVTTIKIADGAVTAAKLAANAVETAKINDRAVTTPKIGDNAVDLTKLATEVTDSIQDAQDTADAKVAPVDLSSIAEGVLVPLRNVAADQEVTIDFRDKLIGLGKIDTSEIPRSGGAAKNIQIDLRSVRPGGRYILEILKAEGVRDQIRINLPGTPLSGVTFNSVLSDQVPEITNAEGLIRVAILVSSLPSGGNRGVSVGLLLPKEFTNEKVSQFLNRLPQAPSLEDLDEILTFTPVREGRPSHSNQRTFSSESTDPIVIDQNSTPPDLIERTYDDRSGSVSPNQSIFCLVSEGIANFDSPEFQFERDDAEALGDLPTNAPRKGLVITDINGNRLEGVLIISTEGKVVLLIARDEFTLTFHYGTSRRAEATYREIPPAGPGRVPLGSIKRLGQSNWEEIGGYRWTFLAADLPSIFPSLATDSPDRMNLKITALPTSRPGLSHLSLFIADINFSQILVGEELKKLPYRRLSERMGEIADGKTQALGNKLGEDIRDLQEQIDDIEESGGGGGESTDFSMTIIGSSLNLTNAESLPAVNAEFDIIFYAQGVNNAPSGNFTALIDGSPIEITEQPTTLMERVNVLTARINNDATRANIIRQAARNDRLDVQILKGTERSNILHVPLHDTPIIPTSFQQREVASGITFDPRTGGYTQTSSRPTDAQHAAVLARAIPSGLTAGQTYRFTAQITIFDIAGSASANIRASIFDRTGQLGFLTTSAHRESSTPTSGFVEFVFTAQATALTTPLVEFTNVRGFSINTKTKHTQHLSLIHI